MFDTKHKHGFSFSNDEGGSDAFCSMVSSCPNWIKYNFIQFGYDKMKFIKRQDSFPENMPKKTAAKRKYDSSRRQARALEAQVQVLDAAHQLFVEKGYAGTTIESIAQRAGVAEETIYSAFGNKPAILTRVVGLTLGGTEDGNPVPPLVRASIQEAASERNQKRQIQLFVKRIRMIMSQGAPLVEVMHSAAKTEPEIQNLLRKYLDGRFQGMGYFIDCLLANGPLQNHLSKLSAVETVWTLTSAEIYSLLVRDRGWSEEGYEKWLSETLIHLLLS
jgi:AcrR family transcriptional regulator